MTTTYSAYNDQAPCCSYSFIAFHEVIHPRAVSEFSYRHNTSGGVAHLFCSFILATASRATEVAELLATLKAKDMSAYDISDNEMAKSHARYMVGGASVVPDERLFRFGMSPITHQLVSISSLFW